MSHRLRSQKEGECGVEQVLERMVKGMRNEMNTDMEDRTEQGHVTRGPKEYG
jgi:hypothetical protein